MIYYKMLEMAKILPEGIDFTALRCEQVNTEEYNPYFTGIEIIESLNKAMESKDFLKAVQCVEFFLENSYLDSEMHILAGYLYELLNNPDKSKFHSKFAERLLRSIFASGDGLSFETAFDVITIREEYAVLHILQLQYMQQMLMEHNNHRFDVFNIADPPKPFLSRIYFNIDRFMPPLSENAESKLSNELSNPLNNEKQSIN